ncbi:MAG: hypothetical protein NZ901_02775 [Geminocystis sp.]|nr:hypothetical protein [Geminocystis sp.]HIK36984.1 hypothetical protein [Geminocystis sp. M7585_C2015_104]MCS7147096.1 hypothetical protein [Geminocystis sp.]MCX8079154.1 hypothetical protein [Geminocystis sp.]MDW8116732.1 hypothetical protein [Geminocystis sp.]
MTQWDGFMVEVEWGFLLNPFPFYPLIPNTFVIYAPQRNFFFHRYAATTSNKVTS